MSSKLSKIWYRVTLLYSYSEFDVYFSKISVIHIFGHILFQNLKFDTGVHCCKLITILMLCFSKFCYLSKFGQNLMFYILIEIDKRRHLYILVTVLMCNFSKCLSFINFGGEISFQNLLFLIFTGV